MTGGDVAEFCGEDLRQAIDDVHRAVLPAGAAHRHGQVAAVARLVFRHALAHEVRDIGSRVIALTTVNARGRASDISLEFPSAGVLDFAADDRITRMRIYLDVSEALRVVGLDG